MIASYFINVTPSYIYLLDKNQQNICAKPLTFVFLQQDITQ